MGHRGCYGHIYMASANDQGCGDVNQFYFSFGLDDRYLILIVTKCYRDISETVTLTASLTRKLNDHPLAHTRMISAGLRYCQSPSLSQDMLILLLRCMG